MGLFDIIKKGNGQLEKPGDKFSAEITKSGRGVAKLSKDNGNFKYSETHYKNGTVVKTQTEKRKEK